MKPLLVFLEDPGAVTMTRPVLEMLRQRQMPFTLLTAGLASQRLTDMAPHRIDGTSSAEEILRQHAPAAVLAGTSENPDSFGLALLAAARAAQIPTMAMVDAATNAGHRFRGRSEAALAYAPDRLLAVDPQTAEAFRQLGFPEQAILVCGHPAHEQLSVFAARQTPEQRQALRTHLYPDANERRIILFLGEISTGFDDREFQRSASYTLQGTGASERRTDIVLEELILALHPFMASAYLAVRPHPKNRADEYALHATAIDKLADGPDGPAACLAADLVVGMTTSLLAEAHAMGCETISLLPRQSEASWQPLVAQGRIPLLTDRTALQQWLAAWFTAPPRGITGNQQRSAIQPTATILKEIDHVCAR